jgi:hypothetical protein
MSWQRLVWPELTSFAPRLNRWSHQKPDAFWLACGFGLPGCRAELAAAGGEPGLAMLARGEEPTDLRSELGADAWARSKRRGASGLSNRTGFAPEPLAALVAGAGFADCRFTAAAAFAEASSLG